MKKIILINFFFIIIVIFLLEILVRTTNLAGVQGYDKDLFYSENDITLSKPNKKLKIFGKFSKTDSNGFRIPLENFSYDDNKKSILILGDSVSFGVGMNEKDTFVGLMRKKSKENLLNSSISGHNLKSHSYLLKKYHEKFREKINNVVIILCLNDIISFQGVVKKNNEKKNNFINKNIKNNIAIKINVFFREKSALFVFFKGSLTNPVKRHFRLMNSFYEDNSKLDALAENLSYIQKYATSNNLNIKFVLLPYAYQIQKKCVSDLMRPQKNIKKIFNKLNLKIYDYTENFCKYSGDEKLFLPFDPVHLSKYGHIYVLKLLKSDKIFK